MSTTDVQGKLTFSDGSFAHMWANGFTDTSETEIQIRDITGTAVAVGNGASGKRIVRVQLQCSDGSYAGPLKYIKKDGRVAHWWYGSERADNDGTDLDVQGLNIPVEQGDVMKITTQD